MFPSYKSDDKFTYLIVMIMLVTTLVSRKLDSVLPFNFVYNIT
jgi:hypothetical protein